MDKPVLPPHFWRNLAKNNPLGIRNITARDAQDWFDYVWPVMEEYAERARTRPNHKLRIKQWWQKIELHEIDRARARGDEIRRRGESDRLTQIASKVLPSEPQQTRSDLPPLKTRRGRGNG